MSAGSIEDNDEATQRARVEEQLTFGTAEKCGAPANIVHKGDISYALTKSFKTTLAALRPGAPITPPPGCAPAPHM